MKLIAPSYYPAFSCIADACRHSCCIGWEIDIDDKTAQCYRTVPGEIGERMRANIDFSADPPHFVLQGTQERCPFLNERGLCDIILTCGEDALCQICTDHPRYRNFFSDRTEIGLGLCCEAAAELVLGWEEPVSMICLSDDGENTIPTPTDEECAFYALRESLFAILQNRDMPLDERLAAMLSRVGGIRYDGMRRWSRFLGDLEILDDAWTKALAQIGDEREALPGCAGEQLIIYLLTRHLPKMLDGEDPAVLVSFAVWGDDLICALYASCEDGDFESLCEFVRLFSSEIEYSEENLYAVFDEIASSCP